MRDPDRMKQLEQDAGYPGGDTGLAISEGFARESAVALELIIKAVIAKRLELRRASPTERVPATHDIPNLWKEAKLPDLGPADRYRLLLVKSTLLWSGRYATPRTVKAWAEENAKFQTFVPPPLPGKTVNFWQPPNFGWSDFDRLYQIANDQLLLLRG